MQENSEDIQFLQRRAQRKFINDAFIVHFQNLQSPLTHAYRKTLDCGFNVLVNDGKTSSRYCKRSWCRICQPIRTAVRINNYRQQLEALGDLHLTTLTMQNMPADRLKECVGIYRYHFRAFRDMLRKRGEQFAGVYNIETTFNVKTGLYHPHIHILHNATELIEKSRKIGSSSTVNELCLYWVEHCDRADLVAQDSRQCYELIEAFKYQSLSTVKDIRRRLKYVPVNELDAMYTALAGVRMFQPFGIRRVLQEQEDAEFDNLESLSVEKPSNTYLWQTYDWLTATDIRLADYLPNERDVFYRVFINNNDSYV